ncbi:MAG: hypothetical protein QCH99_04700 [Candidatus Bathyarchaeota archaeon]|nr:hypothetical protein [Candidatus Bathyarchaeum tardum]
MPIIRSLMNIGDSKGVTLPVSWIKHAEEEQGKKIVALALEVNHSILITPIFEKGEVTKDETTQNLVEAKL